MWIFVWILLSVFVLGVFAWSIQILFQQKKVWKAFADKHGWHYEAGKMTASPSMMGAFGDHRVALFSDSRQMPDARGQRFFSVIEIEMDGGMPMGGVFATPDMAPLLNGLNFTQTFNPAGDNWKASYIVRTNDKEALKDYLTPERQKALHAIFSMKGASAIFLFDQEAAALRIETVDPLRGEERLEKILVQFVKAADMLSLKGDGAGKTENKKPAPKSKKPKTEKAKKAPKEVPSKADDAPAQDETEK